MKKHYGHQFVGKVDSQVAVIVCTIEKAYPLIRRLKEDGKLHRLGCVVVDELHMVSLPRSTGQPLGVEGCIACHLLLVLALKGEILAAPGLQGG